MQAGSLAVTGQAAAMAYGGTRQMSMQAGSLSVTGLAAAMAYGGTRQMSMQAGSLAVTGLVPVTEHMGQILSAPLPAFIRVSGNGALLFLGNDLSSIRNPSLTDVTPARRIIKL